MFHLFCSFFAVGSRDMSCRIFSLYPIPGFHYVTLAAHRTALVACFFQHHSLNVRLPPSFYNATLKQYTLPFCSRNYRTLFFATHVLPKLVQLVSLLTLHTVGLPLHTNTHTPLYTSVYYNSALCVCLQVYTVAKDGALVVWECSMTLTEMQDYIKTTTTRKDKEEEGEGEEEEEEEGVEQMTAGDEKSDSDVGSEDSDEEEAVPMETVAMVTRLGRRKGDSSDSDGEQDGKYYHKLVPCSHGNSKIVSLSCSPPGTLK